VKRLTILAVLLVVTSALAGSITRTVEYTADAVTLSSENGYTVVELAGGLAQVNPGMPRLPRVVQSLAIPAGANPERVELVAEDWITLPGSYRVGPSQPDVRLPMPGRIFTPRFYPEDASVYGSAKPYPEAKVRLLTPGTMSGYRIANVELCPVRYLPASGQLQLATRMSFRLDYTTSGTEAVLSSDRQREQFGNMMRHLVVNQNAVNGFAPRIGRSGSVTTLPPGQYDYVVITEAPMDTVFQRLAAWKTARGVPGNLVLVSWINTNYTGYDLQEKIRNFIIDANQTWGTMYVLLGGQGDPTGSGQNIVPTRMGNCESENEPCDHYYECLDGTWDANGNHTYGERADNPDLYADVYVGRAPVYTIAMAQNFVRKVLTYEQNPPTGFIKKLNLATGILWSSYEERPMQESIARMTPSGWTDQRLYERTGALSNAAMVDSMNHGMGLGQWDGHGDQNGIYMNGGTVPFFTSTDADALTNADKGGVALSIACDAGGWDMCSGGDCFAEHLVNNTHGGVIASIMNSRYGYGAIGPGGGYVPGPSERYDTTYCAAVINWGLYHTGEALGYAKSSWAPYADSLYGFAETRYCAYDLNLIGDPEAPVWTDEPATCNVAHAGVITIGSHIPFPVTVTAPGGAPIAGARVVAHKGNEVNETGTTNGSGQVTLDLSPTTPGQMSLLVSAHNYFVHLDTVQVISTSRYVAYLRSTIEDPAPGGNGDSILNPGEAVKIVTWVKNWGTQTANSVTAKLRTRDANAQITDSAKSFGTINAGDSVSTGSNGFGLHVNGGLANGYSVACSLLCRDALDSCWVSLISYMVGAPALNFRSFAVRDSPIGNGNGKVDPNEECQLEVTINNAGGGHSYNTWAKLRSADSRLQVLDSISTIGLIRRGDDANNLASLFRIHADASIPLETPISCTLLLYADGGYTNMPGFTLVVGEIRSVDPIPDGPRTPALYYAYDDVDVNYPPHPTYNWIEVNGRGARVTLSDDQTQPISIPTAFGPLRYYGTSYAQISIGSNGFVVFGSSTTAPWTNAPLPSGTLAAPVICANWDDLYPPTGNGVWWMHDPAAHALVVEWDSVCYYPSSSGLYDKFEIVIFDSSQHSPSGDNVFEIQYKTANNYVSNTVGIQNADYTIAIPCLYNASYHRGCATLAPGRAIKFTTDLPTGIADDEVSLAGVKTAEFIAYPNPFRGKSTIAWSVKTEGKVSLKVYDPSGRMVRNLVETSQKPGRYQVTWDGKADDGKTIATGVYFYKLETASGAHAQKVVVTK
jgi:hypothetical protein